MMALGLRSKCLFTSCRIILSDIFPVPKVFTMTETGFATPIAYPSSLLHEPWRTLYGLNPMVGVVEGFRWALLGSYASPGPMLMVSTLAAVIILISGAFYFRRTERTFADLI